MKLYELSNQLAAIIGSDDDELTPDTEAALTALELAFETKAEGVLQARQGMLAEADAVMAEADRLYARAAALTRRAEWLKGYMHHSMSQLGIGKLSTTTFTASICKSPPRVELVEGCSVPQMYQRLTVNMDKTAVLADHKRGAPLPASIRIVADATHLKIS